MTFKLSEQLLELKNEVVIITFLNFFKFFKLFHNSFNETYFCLLLLLPQTPGTLLKNDSNQLINTTVTNGNIASPQSTPTESKEEVNSDKCPNSLSNPKLSICFEQNKNTLPGYVDFLISLFSLFRAIKWLRNK